MVDPKDEALRVSKLLIEEMHEPIKHLNTLWAQRLKEALTLIEKAGR